MSGLASAADADVWEYAAAQDFVIVSKDSDFHQRSFLFGGPPKVVWARLGNCTTAEIQELLLGSVDQIRAFIEATDDAFLVLSGQGRD